jgi:hypothetical protein
MVLAVPSLLEHFQLFVAEPGDQRRQRVLGSSTVSPAHGRWLEFDLARCDHVERLAHRP